DAAAGDGLAGAGLADQAVGLPGPYGQADPATAVAFPCPVCRQRLRVPAGRPLRARCRLCGTVLDCAG
ncbi:hypothetical protein ABZ615_36940, partial [Streptomyces sp. NPDC007325]